ncbi:pyrroloquinoline quinone biosynthesis peptide chaperone PqqD [Frigidibacter sp. MR17.14]|uniref:pyrroloquinoline quinone biosynthesis peptide chaperone PqqD n=1 Tax=Frigidibacter sp. MR17.14 TaxID=3126509 RepID=UPI003012BD04
MTAGDVPLLPRGVRWRWDAVRGTHVLLGPERALMLDEIGHAVIAEVDGTTDLAGIAARLAERYGAPEEVIREDVAEFLGSLVATRLVEIRP